MQSRRFEKAISGILIILILTAVTVGSAIAFLANPFLCFGVCSTPPEGISLQTGSFYYSTGEFNFSITNSGSETTITNVTVSNILCTGNFPMLKQNSITLAYCTVLERTFTKGEVINFTINAINGQSISGKLSAQ